MPGLAGEFLSFAQHRESNEKHARRRHTSDHDRFPVIERFSPRWIMTHRLTRRMIFFSPLPLQKVAYPSAREWRLFSVQWKRAIKAHNDGRARALCPRCPSFRTHSLPDGALYRGTPSPPMDECSIAREIQSRWAIGRMKTSLKIDPGPFSRAPSSLFTATNDEFSSPDRGDFYKFSGGASEGGDVIGWFIESAESDASEGSCCTVTRSGRASDQTI